MDYEQELEGADHWLPVEGEDASSAAVRAELKKHLEENADIPHDSEGIQGIFEVVIRALTRTD